MSALVTKEQVCERFFWHIRNDFRTQGEAADHYGVSRSYISAIGKGKKAPNKRMLKALGIERKIIYLVE